MSIKRILLAAAVSMAAVCVPAQNKCGGINLSLWKGLCTQPADSTQTTYLNIGLMSALHRLNGVGINVLGSVVKQDMNGCQITGLANLAGGRMRGLQLAGISNICGENSRGLSLAGLVNLAGDHSSGIIVSGLTNISGHHTNGLLIGGLMNVTGNQAAGWQVAGAANVTGQSYKGVMTAGLLNVVGESTYGLQIAGLANITAHRLYGVQVGLCNYTTEGSGVQIGLVNFYQKDFKGVQLGLVNAHPDTRVQLLAYSGNTNLAHLGVRFKNRLFYTILGVGSLYRGLNDKFSISASYRGGLSLPLYKGLSVSGDLGYEHIEACSNKDQQIPRRLYALQGRLNLEYQLTPQFGLFATGGYNLTRRYGHARTFDHKPIVEAGILLF